MRAIAKWSVKNPVTVNLIMILVIVAGLLAATRMKKEIFPQFSLDMIFISVEYPGAAPEEIEEGILVKIEEAIKGIEGIDRILSMAQESFASITVELETGYKDPQRVLDDIKAEVDRLETLPEEAEEPVIFEVIHQEAVINVAVYGDVPERTLRAVAEKVRDDLADDPNISKTELAGVRDYEISVEVSEEALRRYSLTFDRVAHAVKSFSLDLPGGQIKTAAGDVLLRSKGQRYTGPEFEDVPVKTLASGTIVRLTDVAAIIDGFEDTDRRGRFNGKSMAMVQVFKTEEEDTIKISDSVHRYVEKMKRRLPPGVQLAVWVDISRMVKSRINLLLKNGAQGLILVFISLALFLHLGLSFWVAAGIPISFMGALFVLNARGDTINMISLFAFIMTLGILVDDAIIFGENIYRHHQSGEDPDNASVEGVSEVGWPVVMAVTTTIVAFTPLLFIAGIMGKFIAIMPAAVITILIVSLFEALVILPSHVHHSLRKSRPEKARKTWNVRVLNRMDGLLMSFIEKRYTPAIRWVIRNRYFTLSIALGVLIVSVSLVASGFVSFVLFPKGDSEWVTATLRFPLGTPVSVTEDAVKTIESKYQVLNREFAARLEGEPVVKNSLAIAGEIAAHDWKAGEKGAHAAQVFLELSAAETRPKVPAQEVLNRWRELVGQLPGAESLSFSALSAGPGDNPIEVRLFGDDFETLDRASDALKKELRKFPGVFDIVDDFRPGKEEVKVTVKPYAKTLGLSFLDIAKQVRQAFYGEEAARIQRGRNDIKVMVRYTEPERRSLATLNNVRIRTSDGREVPLFEVADLHLGRAYSTVHRIDRKRVVTVSADLNEDVANAVEIITALKKGFLKNLDQQFPGVSYDVEGQEKRRRESLGSMRDGYILALMGIYLLLATQFRSYAQPVIVMSAIPFGLVGAIWGHMIMGLPLTLLSIFGIVALSGIVVNDSLILVDFINRKREKGAHLIHAVEESGRARFRAVLLTSLTTIAGLMPLLLERSFQAQFLIPMAVSISFGLLAATVLTLLLVPAFYLILHDVLGLFRRPGVMTPPGRAAQEEERTP